MDIFKNALEWNSLAQSLLLGLYDKTVFCIFNTHHHPEKLNTDKNQQTILASHPT